MIGRHQQQKTAAVQESTMTKSNVFVLLAACLPFCASALEAVDDEILSDASGQTGVTISASANWVSQQVRIHDLSGVLSSIRPGYENNTGDLLLNGFGIQGCHDAGCTSSTNYTFDINVDAVGGATPVAKLTVAWATGVQRLRIWLGGIGIRNAQGLNEFEFLDLAQGYVDISRPTLPVGSTTPTLSLELGNEPGGHMMTLSQANFGTLNFGTVLLRDKTDNLANNRNLRFDFTMDNVNLSGATVDIVSDGLVMNTPSLSSLNLTFSNVLAGNIATNMGSFGVVGMNLSNLQLKVGGKI
jgi:hypothetical protein